MLLPLAAVQVSRQVALQDEGPRRVLFKLGPRNELPALGNYVRKVLGAEASGLQVRSGLEEVQEQG